MGKSTLAVAAMLVIAAPALAGLGAQATSADPQNPAGQEARFYIVQLPEVIRDNGGAHCGDDCLVAPEDGVYHLSFIGLMEPIEAISGVTAHVSAVIRGTKTVIACAPFDLSAGPNPIHLGASVYLPAGTEVSFVVELRWTPDGADVGYSLGHPLDALAGPEAGIWQLSEAPEMALRAYRDRRPQ